MAEDVGVGDEGETENRGQLHSLISTLTDWKVWWLTFALISMLISFSFNAYFPTLTATLLYITI